jgi:N-acetylglutamate synthase-like GNAT family acetyltransferase
MQKIQVKIRPAVIGDAEQISELFMKVWHTSLKDIVPDGFVDQFEHEKQKQKYAQRAVDPKWILLVAESGGSIVGMIGATDNNSEPLCYQKQIRAMYIATDVQRQSIGTQLLDRILVELMKQQVSNVMLWCIKANHAACSFYEKRNGQRIENVDPPDEYSSMPHVIYAWEFLQ